MISPFDYITSLDHDDVISTFHRLEPVCYNDDGTPDEELIECYSDLLFRERIECRSWLIEKDYFWILEKYFRYGKALFLSSRKSHSPFSDFSIESFLEIEDEVTLSKLQGCNKFLFGKLLCKGAVTK